MIELKSKLFTNFKLWKKIFRKEYKRVKNLLDRVTRNLTHPEILKQAMLSAAEIVLHRVYNENLDTSIPGGLYFTKIEKSKKSYSSDPKLANKRFPRARLSSPGAERATCSNGKFLLHRYFTKKNSRSPLPELLEPTVIFLRPNQDMAIAEQLNIGQNGQDKSGTGWDNF